MRHVVVNGESILMFTVGWTTSEFKNVIVFSYCPPYAGYNLVKVMEDEADELTEYILRNTSPTFAEHIYKRLKNHFE